jgi:hypothetical protein
MCNVLESSARRNPAALQPERGLRQAPKARLASRVQPAFHPDNEHKKRLGPKAWTPEPILLPHQQKLRRRDPRQLSRLPMRPPRRLTVVELAAISR